MKTVLTAAIIVATMQPNKVFEFKNATIKTYDVTDSTRAFIVFEKDSIVNWWISKMK